jgi:hypothetical protein
MDAIVLCGKCRILIKIPCLPYCIICCQAMEKIAIHDQQYALTLDVSRGYSKGYGDENY